MFAGLADTCGSASLELSVDHPATVADLLSAAEAACPALAAQTFRVALDSRYVDDSTALPEVAEIAFIPPVSGG